MKYSILLSILCLIASAASAQTAAKPPATTSQTTKAGAAGVAARMQALGYTNIHDLRRGPDGQWIGKADRNGVPVTVTAEPQGGLTAR